MGACCSVELPQEEIDQIQKDIQLCATALTELKDAILSVTSEINETCDHVKTLVTGEVNSRVESLKSELHAKLQKIDDILTALKQKVDQVKNAAGAAGAAAAEAEAAAEQAENAAADAAAAVSGLGITSPF